MPASRLSGSQNAAATFALAPGDTNPQGIADPPPADMLLTPAPILQSVSTSPGEPLGDAALAAGTTIGLNDNAAGWGWLVDTTPRNASAFTTPGNQGEQTRMATSTASEHEVGHRLGYDHQETGVMEDTLA